MAGDLEFKRTLGAAVPQVDEYTTGGAVEKGDLLTFSGGTVVKVTDNVGGSGPSVIAGLAMADADSGAVVAVMRLDPWVVIEGTSLDTTAPSVGTFQGIDVTDDDISFEFAGDLMFEVLKVVDATAKTIQCVFIGKGATALAT